MPNEYEIYNLGVEVLTDAPVAGAPRVRVFTAGLEILTSFIDSTINPNFLNLEEFEVLYPPEVKQAGVVLSGPEINPYRPTIPDELWDFSPILARYLREQAEILRRQHNLTQAGDTTFPWELLTTFSDSQTYNLGAVGRFYHPEYGIIIARYVQFSDWAIGSSSVGPVGYLNSASVQNWVVTNDLTLSRNDLLVGMAFLQSVPTQGSYGWAVIEGGNPLSIPGFGIPDGDNETYTWKASGVIQVGGLGRIVGVRKSSRNDSLIKAGEFYVKVEGLSEESIIELVQEQLDSIAGSSSLLAGRVTDLEADMATEQSLSLSFANSILNLTDRLAKEEQTRSGAIDALYAQLEGGSVTQAELDAAILALTIAYTSKVDGLSIRIDAAQSRADVAYNLAAAIDSVGILNEIAGLTAGLTAANSRILALESQPASGKIIPVVTGDIPPVLVYDEDGSLVYTEI